MTVPLNPVTAVTAPDPYPYYAQLVAERPFGWSEELGVWVAASAAAVSAVLAEPGLRVRPAAEPVPAGIVDTAAGDIFGRLVRMTDGPAQRHLKEAVRRCLATPDPDRLAAIAAERTRLALRGPTPSRDAMFGVPAYTVAVLCGLAGHEAEQATRLISDFVACIPASATVEQQAGAALAAEGLLGLIGPALDERRDGLLGALAGAARPGTDRAALLANGVGLLSQTFDATAGLTGGLLVTLGRYADAEHRRPAELPAAAREVARYDAPIQNTRRFAVADVTVAGVRIAAGEAVLVVLAAANRDPAGNPEPDAFRPGRHRPAVFTFGAGGHGCPGASIAVGIATAVVGELLAAGIRPEDLRPSGHLPLTNARIPVLHP